MNAQGPELRPMVRRLLCRYDSATPSELLEGLYWYDRAEAFIYMLALRTGLPRVEVAGIVAVLSPSVSWAVQVQHTLAWILDTRGTYAGYGVNLDKARRIVSRQAHAETVVTGGKVRSFWRNLSGDHDAVTVDRHAIRAATGDDTAIGCNGSTLRAIQAAHVRAARARNVDPRALQAVVWTVQRRRTRGSRRVA